MIGCEYEKIYKVGLSSRLNPKKLDTAGNTCSKPSHDLELP